MEWLRYGAQHYPNRICINEYTYNDIYRGVLHVARNLVPLDASRVAILSDNSLTMANVCVGCYASSQRGPFTQCTS